MDFHSSLTGLASSNMWCVEVLIESLRVLCPGEFGQARDWCQELEYCGVKEGLSLLHSSSSCHELKHWSQVVSSHFLYKILLDLCSGPPSLEISLGMLNVANKDHRALRSPFVPEASVPGFAEETVGQLVNLSTVTK